MKALPFRARRQASVATSRIRRTRCCSSLRRQTRSACTVRRTETRDSTPDVSSPAPSWTAFEKLSITFT